MPTADEIIAAAVTPEGAVRSQGRLTFLRHDASGPDAAMTFCRGPMDYIVSNLQTSGARTNCRLRVQHGGEMLFSGSVNLDSVRTRRQLLNDYIIPKADGERREDLTEDMMALADLARDTVVDLLSRGAEDVVVMTPEDERQGLELAQRPDLLAEADEMMDRLGIVEEHRNRLIIYLALTSRILDQPVNIMMRGESSAGKSYIVRQVMRLFPPEALVELTEATAKSFYYLPDDSLSHRFVVIFEQPGAEASDYTIRTLQSEGKLIIQTTVKNPKTQRFETMRKELHGPVGFITTTTQARVNFENETRLLPLFADETPGQTRRILAAHAAWRQTFDPGIDDEALRPWHNLQRVLRRLPIVIPFADKIAAQFPKHNQRTRRDFPRFLALMDAIVTLHQYRREVKRSEHGEYLEATAEDYAVARFLLEGPLQRAIAELSPRTIQILNHCVQNRYLGPDEHPADALMGPMDDGGQLRIFTYDALAQIFRWKKSTLRKWVGPLFDNNYLLRLDDKKGGASQKARFTVNMAPQGVQVLAALTDVAGPDASWSTPKAWLQWPRSDDGLPNLLSEWGQLDITPENVHEVDIIEPSDISLTTEKQNMPDGYKV